MTIERDPDSEPTVEIQRPVPPTSAGDDDDIGVMVRYVDADNYYRFSLNRQIGFRRLVRFLHGQFTVLWEDPWRFQLDVEYELTVEVRGDQIRVLQDGVVLALQRVGHLRVLGDALECSCRVAEIENLGNRKQDVFAGASRDGFTAFLQSLLLIKPLLAAKASRFEKCRLDGHDENNLISTFRTVKGAAKWCWQLRWSCWSSALCCSTS